MFALFAGPTQFAVRYAANNCFRELMFDADLVSG